MSLVPVKGTKEKKRIETTLKGEEAKVIGRLI